MIAYYYHLERNQSFSVLLTEVLARYDMESKSTFCYQAITDIQTTIRAIDTKIGFLIVIIFIPIAGIKEIVTVYSSIASSSQCLSIIMWLIACAWVATIAILFRALVSIRNPADSVKDNDASGVFFNSSHYNMGGIDCLFNFPIKSSVSLNEATLNIPDDDSVLLKELVFEKMKLEYIRDIKIRRCSAASVLMLVWIASGVSLYVYSLIGR